MNMKKLSLVAVVLFSAGAMAQSGTEAPKTDAPAAKTEAPKADAKADKVAKNEAKKQARKDCKAEGKKGKDLSACIKEKLEKK